MSDFARTLSLISQINNVDWYCPYIGASKCKDLLIIIGNNFEVEKPLTKHECISLMKYHVEDLAHVSTTHNHNRINLTIIGIGLLIKFQDITWGTLRAYQRSYIAPSYHVIF